MTDQRPTEPRLPGGRTTWQCQQHAVFSHPETCRAEGVAMFSSSCTMYELMALHTFPCKPGNTITDSLEASAITLLLATACDFHRPSTSTWLGCRTSLVRLGRNDEESERFLSCSTHSHVHRFLFGEAGPLTARSYGGEVLSYLSCVGLSSLVPCIGSHQKAHIETPSAAVACLSISVFSA